MTNWIPNLTNGTGPLYVRLADHLERDIESGRVAPGTKLPPQRNLAFDIGVTIGTVSRAYALARERGLVAGEVGRGTFVQPRTAMAWHGEAPATPEAFRDPAPSAPPRVLRLDTTAAPEIGVAPVVAALSAEVCRDHPEAVATYIRTVPDSWRAAGVRWLSRSDWAPPPADVVPTQGAHAAIMSAIAAVTAPGDRIVFEPLTYASIARSCALIGRRPVVVPADPRRGGAGGTGEALRPSSIRR